MNCEVSGLLLFKLGLFSFVKIKYSPNRSSLVTLVSVISIQVSACSGTHLLWDIWLRFSIAKKHGSIEVAPEHHKVVIWLKPMCIFTYQLKCKNANLDYWNKQTNAKDKQQKQYDTEVLLAVTTLSFTSFFEKLNPLFMKAMNVWLSPCQQGFFFFFLVTVLYIRRKSQIDNICHFISPSIDSRLNIRLHHHY